MAFSAVHNVNINVKPVIVWKFEPNHSLTKSEHATIIFLSNALSQSVTAFCGIILLESQLNSSLICHVCKQMQ